MQSLFVVARHRVICAGGEHLLYMVLVCIYASCLSHLFITSHDHNVAIKRALCKWILGGCS